MSNIRPPYAGLQLPFPVEMNNVHSISNDIEMVVEPQLSNFSTIPINLNPRVGRESTLIRCPQCKCTVTTDIRYRSTVKTHLACLLLSWTCCFCCLPYCMNSCRDANHFCPMCGTFIGTYES